MDDETRMDENTIRENLRKVRTSLGYTQADVADRLDISVTAYQKLESGKTKIINRHFYKCAEIFGVSTSELANGFKPVKDADSFLREAQESYGRRLNVMENGYIQEIQRKDREIERLNDIIKDKEETISTQKLLIRQLMGQSKN